MRVLITGASGFIGSYLTNRLLQNPGHEVAIICRQTSNLNFFCESQTQPISYTYDGTTSSLINAINCFQPDLVIHLASYFVAEHRSTDVESLISSNILFGTQLLEAMLQSSCKMLINTGTAWQFYHSTSYHPSCLYAATKQAFEAIIDYYVSAHEFRCFTLYIYDTYGPHDPRKKLFSLLMNLAEGKSLSLAMSAGQQKITFLHIEDAINAYEKAIELLVATTSHVHQRYALPGPEILSLRELVEKVSAIVGKDLPIEWGKRPYRKREVMEPWQSGQTLPDWQAHIKLEDGIKSLLASK